VRPFPEKLVPHSLRESSTRDGPADLARQLYATGVLSQEGLETCAPQQRGSILSIVISSAGGAECRRRMHTLQATKLFAFPLKPMCWRYLLVIKDAKDDLPNRARCRLAIG
jgi:hypothetical protein